MEFTDIILISIPLIAFWLCYKADKKEAAQAELLTEILEESKGDTQVFFYCVEHTNISRQSAEEFLQKK